MDDIDLNLQKLNINDDKLIADFGDACVDEDFDTFKKCIDKLNVLQIISKKCLNSCINSLIIIGNKEYLEYLFPHKVDISVLDDETICTACEKNNIFILKLKINSLIKTRNSKDIATYIANGIFRYKHLGKMYKLREIYTNIKNNISISDEKLLEKWIIFDKFYPEIAYHTITEIAEYIMDPTKKNIPTEKIRECFDDLIKNEYNNRGNIIKEMINYNLFPDLETNNYYIKQCFQSGYYDVIDFMIKKGANLEKVIFEEKDPYLKQRFEHFRNEHYPLPDVKKAE